MTSCRLGEGICYKQPSHDLHLSNSYRPVRQRQTSQWKQARDLNRHFEKKKSSWPVSIGNGAPPCDPPHPSLRLSGKHGRFQAVMRRVSDRHVHVLPGKLFGKRQCYAHLCPSNATARHVPETNTCTGMPGDLYTSHVHTSLIFDGLMP